MSYDHTIYQQYRGCTVDELKTHLKNCMSLSKEEERVIKNLLTEKLETVEDYPQFDSDEI